MLKIGFLSVRLAPDAGGGRAASWVSDTPQREIGEDIRASVRNDLHDMGCLMIHARSAASYKREGTG